jgi:hypothetical protein
MANEEAEDEAAEVDHHAPSSPMISSLIAT